MQYVQTAREILPTGRSEKIQVIPMEETETTESTEVTETNESAETESKEKKHKKKKEPKPFIEFVGDYRKSAAAQRSKEIIETKLKIAKEQAKRRQELGF